MRAAFPLEPPYELAGGWQVISQGACDQPSEAMYRMT